jgi:iron uptake system component EfeO
VAAVKARDIEKAKALYPVARTYWERIEPVAEVFGDLDPAIDGREGDEAVDLQLADPAQAPAREFTGFHRLEKDLWVTRDLSTSGPVADRLLDDVKKVVEQADAARLSPVQLAGGAKELLDEVATGKITGEENRYSHTDLWDFAANLEGAKAAVAALRPVLEAKSSSLVATLDGRFAAAEAALGQHRTGDGWKLHTDLSPAELKHLSDVVNALAEPVSGVAAVVAAR